MDLNKGFVQEKLLGPSTAYQLVLSKWGAAAVVAGLEMLLDQDLTLETEQRFALGAMTRDIRKLLGEDIVIEQEPEDEAEVIALPAPKTESEA